MRICQEENCFEWIEENRNVSKLRLGLRLYSVCTQFYVYSGTNNVVEMKENQNNHQTLKQKNIFFPQIC